MTIKRIRNNIFYFFKDMAWTHPMNKKSLLFITGFKEFKYESGEPNICDNCFYGEFEEVATDHINSIVCEAELKCKRCGKKHGFFAYGHWGYK